MKQGLLILIIFAVISCAEEKVNNTDESTSISLTKAEVENKPSKESQEIIANTSLVESLKLETFSTYSDDFIGCGCSYFLSDQDKQKGSFIYIDVGDIAMVKLNGQVQIVNYKGQGKGFTYYSNDSIEVKRRTTKSVESTEMEETTDVEGVLTVTKGQYKVEKEFVGYCGC
ncbi:hypothetical protein [Pontibacter fetidus]|uniref:Lipoprotein n=1 Tax=Pontibacter fetidus TaxID=2700082 RepID=A0A6B2GX58_9BACT|nr:hypothetical protein [Pontibacter fetidus]NDK55415.1 hypothetical protein [Pontibacter fetidus]